MYYIILYTRLVALGPFMSRGEAYTYAGNVMQLNVSDYTVKSDRVCQQEYQHLTIEAPPVH